jgi:hypothetical protein
VANHQADKSARGPTSHRAWNPSVDAYAGEGDFWKTPSQHAVPLDTRQNCIVYSLVENRTVLSLI